MFEEGAGGGTLTPLIIIIHDIIGASLSEAHIGELQITAVCVCTDICNIQCIYTYCKYIMANILLLSSASVDGRLRESVHRESGEDCWETRASMREREHEWRVLEQSNCVLSNICQ